jgi:ribosomal protein S18 acetylase RimI-like enzyme
VALELTLGVVIRPLAAGDLDDLDWDSSRAVDAAYIRADVAARPGAAVWLLALAQGRPVGRIGVDFASKAEEGVVHLWAFSVLPVLQGYGVGSALLRAAEAVAADEGPAEARALEIGVEEENVAARRPYERFGYAFYCQEQGQLGEPILLLRKPLER